ncbi:MAG: hypothetical protein JXI33_04770 [Candidatus Aminicenantes bacterium]|nr:hypothetical protein [Candidatus Aminicenantes bacterium]
MNEIRISLLLVVMASGLAFGVNLNGRREKRPAAEISDCQVVTTMVSGFGINGPDGFAMDKDGNLYVANWGNGIGDNILKISKQVEVSEYLKGLSAPDGLVFDDESSLFISNFASGIITKVSANGVRTEFARGLNNPSALVFDKRGNLYVSNHGNGKGRTVSRITPDGVVSTFASGFDAPLGLAFDSKENLYVSNYNSGIIHKVTPQGDVSEFARIGNVPLARLQYLAFDKNGNLYVPSYGHNKIYRISPWRKVDVFAGSGKAGGSDGSLQDAEFNGPNSIVIDPSGIIYISEYNANRIRKITIKIFAKL